LAKRSVGRLHSIFSGELARHVNIRSGFMRIFLKKPLTDDLDNSRLIGE
jgi:hypothetical protein